MGDFVISTNQMVGMMIGVAVLVVALILVFRYFLSKKATEDLSEKYAGKEWASPLTARTKYPDVDVFKFGRSFLWAGGIASLLFIIFAFNWTQFEQEVAIPDDAWIDIDEIEMEPPRTAEPPPPPPPPPPPVIEEVPEEEIEEEEQPEFLDQEVEEETVIKEEPPEIEDAPPPPPPPPPPPEPEVEEIFKVVEQQPRFPGCEDMSGTNKEKEECAKTKMLEFIYKNIKYPAIARENGVQGMCVVRFVVEKDGTVANAEVVRDIGAGCGDESLRIVKMMNQMPQRWTPGKQRGKNVRVQYNLPVRFKLEN